MIVLDPAAAAVGIVLTATDLIGTLHIRTTLTDTTYIPRTATGLMRTYHIRTTLTDTICMPLTDTTFMFRIGTISMCLTFTFHTDTTFMCHIGIISMCHISTQQQ